MAKGSKLSARHLLRREQDARRQLGQLTDLLAKAAAVGVSDERLTKEERERLMRQRDVLSGSVAELITILTDHQPAEVCEYRIYKLFEALGSACVLGNRYLVDPIRNRLSVLPATNAKKAKAKSQWTKNIIVEAAEAIRRKHPSYAQWRIAGEIRKLINQKRSAEGLAPLRQSAIAKQVPPALKLDERTTVQ